MKAQKVALTAFGAVCALSLTACGGGGAPSQSGQSESGTASARANTMYTWMSNESDREQWETFISGVQENGDPDFDLTLEGPSFPEYWTLVKTRMSAPDAPCILTTQAARAQELGELLLPLDDLAAEAGLDLAQYNDGMMEGMTVDGTVRALPYDAEPTLLYYNKEAFQEAGLEEPGANYTRDQFLLDAKALTDGDRFGFWVGADIDYPFLPIAFANGNTPVADGQIDLTNEAFVDDIQWAMDLVAKEGVAATPTSSTVDEEGRQAFFAGKVAMHIDGPWFYSDMVNESPFEVGVAAPPSTSGESHGMIQGSGFGISASCPEADQKAAFENIMKMTTPEVVGYVGQHRGTVPSIASALDAWSEGKPAEHVAVVEALLENGLPKVTTTNWNQVVVQFTQYSPEGSRGTRTASDILSAISQSVG